MKVAIVGSRDFEDPARVEMEVWEYVGSLPAGTVVVSGGARGVDTWAAEAADAHGLETRIFEAPWDEYGKRAGFVRNVRIAHDCDRLVAFWNGSSRGTQHVVKKARDVRKPVKIRRFA